MAKVWKRVAVGAVALVLLVAAVVAAFAVNRYLDPFDDQPFDRAVWTGETEHVRRPMARAAIQQIPAGTTAERVRELLGEPDDDVPPTGDRWGTTPRHGRLWAYYIGYWDGLGPYQLDAAFVYVHFDHAGRVVVAEIGGG